jgi:hypothetical protein
MKKVRYLIGAAGALAVTPALGVFPPAAHAATAQSAARPAGKTVSLNQRAAPAGVACPAQSHKHAHSGTGVNKFQVSVGGTFDQLTPCLGYESTSLDHRQAGLKLRTRTYLNGVEKSWGLVGGTVSRGHTTFGRTFNASTHADQVCDALVYSTSPKAPPAYGPVCINL